MRVRQSERRVKDTLPVQECLEPAFLTIELQKVQGSSHVLSKCPCPVFRHALSCLGMTPSPLPPFPEPLRLSHTSHTFSTPPPNEATVRWCLSWLKGARTCTTLRCGASRRCTRWRCTDRATCTRFVVAVKLLRNRQQCCKIKSMSTQSCYFWCLSRVSLIQPPKRLHRAPSLSFPP